MENWFKYKFYIVPIMVLSVFALLSMNVKHESLLTTTTNWGFFGHKKINRIAVFTLPPEIIAFYKEHIEYVTENAVNPDKRRYAVKGEAECHFIDIDHYIKYGADPFEVMPKYWTKAVEKFTEDTLRAYGIVPWNIEFVKLKLQRAMENKNLDLILKYSADLGHYVADAHVPLHATENYNGQLSGQKGIHGLWESRLVEINHEDYNYFVGKAKYINNLNEYVWKVVKESSQAVDSVLRIEKELTAEFPSDKKYSYEQRGRVTMQNYSKEFCTEYHKRLNGMVERRLRASIVGVGSIWYTAWVDAGQPDLSKLLNTPPSAELLKEIADLDIQYQNGHAKGRDCSH